MPTIYHNPHCSKSRQTLQLLHDRGIEPTVIEYLKHPPDERTLREVIKMLGIRPIDLCRKKEPAFAELQLVGSVDDPDNDEAILAAMVANPKLIERPIVVKGKQARIGRPPESVLEIL